MLDKSKNKLTAKTGYDLIIKDHYLTVSMLKLKEAESNLIMTWLAGDNETDSMHFECSARHSVGLKS